MVCIDLCSTKNMKRWANNKHERTYGSVCWSTGLALCGTSQVRAPFFPLLCINVLFCLRKHALPWGQVKQCGFKPHSGRLRFFTATHRSSPFYGQWERLPETHFKQMARVESDMMVDSLWVTKLVALFCYFLLYLTLCVQSKFSFLKWNLIWRPKNILK